MEQSICKNCIHFRQHYILDKHSCTAVSCGHCVQPRLKHRRPEDKACAHYKAGTPSLPDREQVVHFLTTEFLQYITSLVLPPEDIN